MLAFSDHRLGASLLASPIQWVGGNDVVAHNLTLLLLFPLCAIGAHALGFTLTHRHDAAAVCGLAYGFNPYRIAHLEHLELLAAYGMPFALAALHQFATTRKTKWIGLFTIALTAQGLSTSYYSSVVDVASRHLQPERSGNRNRRPAGRDRQRTTIRRRSRVRLDLAEAAARR